MRNEIVCVTVDEELRKAKVIEAEKAMRNAFNKGDELGVFDAFCEADDAYEYFRIRGTMLPYEPDHEKWFKYYMDVLEGHRVAIN